MRLIIAYFQSKWLGFLILRGQGCSFVDTFLARCGAFGGGDPLQDVALRGATPGRKIRGGG